MTKSNTQIKEILGKYIAGSYTPEELDQLLTYLKQADTSLFDEQTMSVWMELIQSDSQTSSEECQIFRQEAMQVIRKSSVSDNKRPVRMRQRLSYGWRIAATVALLISLTTLVYWLQSDRINPDTEKVFAYVSATVERGEKKKMQLTDGSSVYLNSGSQLVFPERFNDDSREVELLGEAFFEITPDNTRPFTVKTSGISVKVLGTSFNVKNYENNRILVVTVSTGKVAVDVNDNLIRLLPNEQLRIDKQTGEFEKQLVSAEKHAQWRDGMLYFEHTPIAEVVKTLERWYDIDIRLNKDYPILISGEHDNKSLQAVLEAICFTTGLKYKKENNNSFILYK